MPPPTPASTPRIGELFSGYGGLGMGVQSVYDGTIAWHSDIDKGACKILAHRYPDVPNIGDITTVDWSQVEPVDILTGGSPCQDLSHAGKRQGMTEGTRSNLWVAMREAIAQLRPPTVIWENVRGAYSAEAASELELCPGCMGADRFSRGPVLRALGRVLGDLSDLGYDARWHGLRAADVGACHPRFRVFVAATDTKRGGRIGRTREPIWSSVPRVATAGSGAGVGSLLPTPATSDTNGPEAHGSGGLDLRTAVALLPTPTTTQRGTDANLDTREGARANLHNEVFKLLPTPMVGSSSPASHGQISGQYRDQMAEALTRWGDYAPAVAHWEDVIGRPAPAPTMLSTKGNPQLSPTFVEWLMGLPAGWVDDVPGLTRNEKLKALGNGVVPQQAAEALRVMAGWAVAA